jgi:hypothetical protein
MRVESRPSTLTASGLRRAASKDNLLELDERRIALFDTHAQQRALPAIHDKPSQ